MQIEYYCPIWGSTEMPFDGFIARVKDAGYDGVEMGFPSGDPAKRDLRVAALKNAGLKLIAQHYETENADPSAHLTEYQNRLRFLTETEPEFISSQTGRDFFEFEDNLRIIAAADEIAGETGQKILHETHRSKMTFAAHITKRFLEKLPNMRLTLDISHWFCVHERFLTDQPATVGLAVSRTDHLHARIGHDQGSQVPDFRTPEWRQVLDTHLIIWDRVIATAAAGGRDRFTVTPEFGPAPYTLFKQGTNEPLADQWQLNIDMMALLKERWPN